MGQEQARHHLMRQHTELLERRVRETEERLEKMKRLVEQERERLVSLSEENRKLRESLQASGRNLPSDENVALMEPFQRLSLRDPDTEQVSESAGRDFNCTMTHDGKRGVLAVSEKIEKLLEPAGGSVTVGDCTVEFRPGSFPYKTKVTIKAELDNTKLPEEIVAFTPIFDVKAKMLQRKAKVTLPLLFVLKHADKDQCTSDITIFHQADERQEWKDTNIVIPFSSDPFIEFEWRNFSRVVGGKRKKSSTSNSLSPRVVGRVYASDSREFSIVYYFETDLMLKAVKKILSRRDQKMRSKLQFISFDAEEDATYESNITCFRPEGFIFIPPGPSFFTFGDAFLRQNVPVFQHTTLYGDFRDKNGKVHIVCEVKKDGKAVDNQHGFTHNFEEVKQQKRLPKRRRTDSSQFRDDHPPCSSTERSLEQETPGSKHIHIHVGDNTTAQNYAEESSTITSTQKETDNTISSS